jgi:hypothetical protein
MSTKKFSNEKGLHVELLKHDIVSLDFYIVDLMNHVICIGFLCHGPGISSHPIFKLGGVSDPNIYRAIMIGNTFAKLYTMVLNMWLSDHFERKNFNAKKQAVSRVNPRPLIIYSLSEIIEKARECSSIDLLISKRPLTLFQGIW